MPSDAGQAKLRAIESTDPIVQAVAQEVRAALDELGAREKIPELEIHFPVFSEADRGPEGPLYYTAGCLSLLPATVVVNAEFLTEIEAAIRSFALGEDVLKLPYLRNDACMFGLVKRIREGGAAYLQTLRQFDRDRKAPDHDAVEQLAVTVLFFCAHEIGHLTDGVNAGRYAAFLDGSRPLEMRLGNAAVKLRRHASEFEAYGFDLPGFQGAVLPEHEVFAAVQDLRGPLAEEDDLNAEWFEKETSADDQAVQLLNRYLKTRPAAVRWQLVKGLFAAALYSWYKDLLAFCDALQVARAGPNPMLSFELMKNREAYINAASLFGDVHRATILPSTLAIQAILAAQEDAPDDQPTTLLGRATQLWARLLGKPQEQTTEEAREQRECARRHLLLAIHMDTVVKLAYMGASLPWLVKKGNAAQIFLMQFEPIDASVHRLRAMLEE